MQVQFLLTILTKTKQKNEVNNMIEIENGLITKFDLEGIKFAQDLIPSTNTLARSGLYMSPTSITVHNPASPNNPTAEDLTEYVDNYKGYKSWHLTVVSNKVFQELPFNEVAWHAGDGYNGPGNRSSISLEIFEDRISEETGKVFIAHLMKEYGIPIWRIYPHRHWSGKDCPAFTLKHWDKYVESIEEYYKEITKLPHWGKAHLDNLIGKGFINTPEAWTDFDEPATKAQILALIDKITQ